MPSPVPFLRVSELMRENGAYIWGLNPSMNIRNLWSDGISCRNGEINGFCYGFLNRHAERLLPRVSDALEDAERSLRFFKEDKIVLRYRMYTGITKCFKFEEGLQKLFRGSSLKERQEARKVAEEAAAAELRRLFPELLLPDRPRKSQTTLALHFRPLGGPPLCVTSAAELREANRRDSEQKERKTGDGRKRKRWSPGPSSSQDLRDKVDRPSNVYIISDGESSDSESGWRGLAENRSLESAISGAQSGDEDRALRKAFEESRKSLEFLEREVNGPVADPLEEAMARSLLEQSSDRDLNQALLASACAAQVDDVLARLLDMGFELPVAQDAAATGDLEAALAKLCDAA